MSAVAILARTHPEGDCLVWEGAPQSKGYGAVSGGRKGVTKLTHRVVYEELVGTIPEGMTIDHTCERHACQNVAHMEVVTRAENSRRKWARMTHCKRRHLLAGANLRLTIRRNGRVHRVCRECARIQNLAHRERLAVAS